MITAGRLTRAGYKHIEYEGRDWYGMVTDTSPLARREWDNYHCPFCSSPTQYAPSAGVIGPLGEGFRWCYMLHQCGTLVASTTMYIVAAAQGQTCKELAAFTDRLESEEDTI